MLNSYAQAADIDKNVLNSLLLANGLKTKYANLSEDVKVAVGDVVSAGTEIGTVGNTSGIFTSKLCGDVLNVQVEDVNGKDVDPSAYFIAK